MIDWLRWLLFGKPVRRRNNAKASTARQSAARRQNGSQPRARVETLSQESRPGTGLRSTVEGQAYLNKINQKIHALATRFASGDINRLQFQELYAHYQNERGTIETLLAAEPDTEAWKEAITDGASILIRHRHIARVQGFSIFENESGIPLK